MESLNLNQYEPIEPEQEEQVDTVEEFPAPAGLLDTSEFEASKEDLDAIYGWYANAMSRRDRIPLEQGRFQRHFFEGGSFDKTFMYGDMEKGFILGFCKHGIFIPTHFAPKSMRGGYTLFQELAVSKEIPVVGAVTEDLADTLKKMKGWKTWKISLLSYFNDSLVDKVVVYNSYPKIRRRMLSLVKEFIEESKRIHERQVADEENEGDESDLTNETDSENADDLNSPTN